MSGGSIYLIRIDRAHFCLIVFLLSVFVVCVLARLHGFSIPEWHTQFDGSPMPEVLLGQVRDIRSDDWFAALPTILAQRKHDPAFPTFNKNIGLGQDTVVNSIKTPVRHYVTLFRPHLWGYFLGRDLGLSWHWWSLILGLFYSYFLCFLLVSGGRFLVSISGALLIAYSPFFQFKSGEYGEIAVFAALVFVSLTHVLFGSSRAQRFLNGLLFAWSATGLALNFYPPSQISLCYLLLFLTGGFLLRNRKVLVALDEWRHRFLCLTAGGVLALLTVGLFVAQGWGIIEILNHTVYPGQRFVTGGDYPLWKIFCNNCFLYIFLRHDNASVSSIWKYDSFLFFFPALALWVIYRTWNKGEVDWLIVSMLGLCFCLTAFAIVGFAPWLSAITLMSKVPPHRSMVALGVANAVLLVATVASPQSKKVTNVPPLVTAVAWGFFLLLVAALITREIKTITLAQMAMPVVVLPVILWGLLQEPFKRWSLLALALLSVGATYSFNPIVRGGSAYLYRNPLAIKMAALASRDRDARWATFGTMFFANYPRLLGIPAINGTHSYPQFALWKRLDPTDRFVDQYNRYGHVWFTAAQGEVNIDSPFADQIKVSLSPDSPVLTELNVKYFLVITPEDKFFDNLPNFSKIFTYGRAHIYQKN